MHLPLKFINRPRQPHLNEDEKRGGQKSGGHQHLIGPRGMWEHLADQKMANPCGESIIQAGRTKAIESRLEVTSIF